MSKTDWAAFDAIDDDAVEANALADPDAPPGKGLPVELPEKGDATLLEHFRKARES